VLPRRSEFVEKSARQTSEKLFYSRGPVVDVSTLQEVIYVDLNAREGAHRSLVQLSSMKKLLLLAAVMSATAIAPRAHAGLSFAISIGPRYAPPPVYVAPPVYTAPAPVYVAPSPVCAPAPILVPRPIVVAPPVYIAPPPPRLVLYSHGYRHGHYRHSYAGCGY
jgi:hypothetical protein